MTARMPPRVVYNVPIPPINTMATFEFIEANKNKEVEGPYMNIL